MKKDLIAVATTNIEKKQLWRHVNIKIKRSINHYHVLAVLSILFEELIKDLEAGKQIEIINLGTFGLKQSGDRNHVNIWTKEVMRSKGRKVLKFVLPKKLRQTLCDYLDLDKLHPDEHNE